MRNDRSESLNRFLDELADDAVAPGREIEPDLRATVHWFRDLGVEPTPNPTFRARLEHDLMSYVLNSPMPAAIIPAGTAQIPSTGGDACRQRPAMPLSNRLVRLRWNVMSAAAVLLLMLGLAYVAFGQLRPESGRPRAIPAAFVQATPAVATPDSGVLSEPLLAVTLPAETIPPGQPLAWGWRATFAPGANMVIPASPAERGVAVVMVLEGTFAVRAEAAIRVFRVGGAIEEIAAGTEALLDPGDAVLYLDNTAAVTNRNPGGTQTVVVGTAVIAAQDSEPGRSMDGATGVVLAILGGVPADTWAQAGYVAGSLSVSLQRVTVAPGEVLPLADETVPTLRFVESGSLTWVFAGSEATPAGPAETIIFYRGQYVLWPPPDRTQVLRNDGAEPLVVLELTISPAEGSPGTPAP